MCRYTAKFTATVAHTGALDGELEFGAANDDDAYARLPREVQRWAGDRLHTVTLKSLTRWERVTLKLLEEVVHEAREATAHGPEERMFKAKVALNTCIDAWKHDCDYPTSVDIHPVTV